MDLLVLHTNLSASSCTRPDSAVFPIPESQAPCHPIVPLVPLPGELTVDFLIDEETRQWKEELVHACFRPADAERIVKMPLSHNRTEDVAS